MTGEPPGEPLDDAALRTLLAPWLGPGGRAHGAVVAVSGGPDSVALMGAAALCDRRRAILVATVDHGLRPRSGAEAGLVAEAAAVLGLAHRTLVWDGPKPRTGIQAAARAARHALLAQAAREAGASHILAAHTLDDQAETVLMRLARGSDLAGLSGMRRETRRDGVWLGRPLLGIAKARLVATCRARGWAFVTDPANADPRFARSRLRTLLPALAHEGLTARRLATFAARAERAERALDAQARAAWDALAPRILGEGCRVVAGAALLALPEAVALRIVARLVGEAAPPHEGGRDGPAPRLERLERLVLREILPALASGTVVRRTLGGALVTTTRAGDCVVGPAPPRRRTGEA